MTSELLTFTTDRLTRLKAQYTTAVSSGEQSFQFDGYDFLVDYAKNLIEDLEDYFEKSKKPQQVYRFSGNSM